jgi:shikimate kinase
MSVILIGYRGSGKSTVGRKLADRLWQTFVDLDELIVRRAGRTIREIFEQDGEAAFRDLETAALREVLPLQDHVMALGGGAVLREENRRAIAASGHRVIYLRCEPEVLARRIAADPNTAASRPALTSAGSSVDEVQRVLAEREPLYRATMHGELDVTNLSADDAVVYLVRMM